jgi:hypothetical protein
VSPACRLGPRTLVRELNRRPGGRIHKCYAANPILTADGSGFVTFPLVGGLQFLCY